MTADPADPVVHPEAAPQDSPATAPKTGAEPILDSDGDPVDNVLGFWRWSSSNLLDNTMRGLLAEYLVGLATNCVGTSVRQEWDAHDLKTGDGITIEVKSSSHLQSWHQVRPATLRFGIAPHLVWDAATATYSTSPSRPADVYVFCIFTVLDRPTANPSDTRQWTFLVVPTRRINEVLGKQKTITAGSLRAQLHPTEVAFSGLAAAIRSAAAQ